MVCSRGLCFRCFRPAQVEERKYKQRAKFGKKPRYGTVGETLYAEGERGLVDQEV